MAAPHPGNSAHAPRTQGRALLGQASDHQPHRPAARLYNRGMRESDLLAHIYAANAQLNDAVVAIPPGDDMAALRLPAAPEGDDNTTRGDVLVTVDQLADAVHFNLADTPLHKIARKAVTRNLSDVAAMAAVPLAAVAAVCLPRGFTQQQAATLFDALRRAAAEYDCPLVGGDIAVWDGRLIITVTILAHAGGVDPVRRDAARAGDAIFVTGTLGGSLVTVDGRTHHLDFEPRLRVARQLAFLPDIELHAMIDLSDGLAADLPRICHASAVRAELWVDHLPVSRAAHLAEKADATPAWRHALEDGEDYELLFTVPAEHARRLQPGVFNGIPVTHIGRILPRPEADAGPPVTLRWADGRTQPMPPGGWEHAARHAKGGPQT